MNVLKQSALPALLLQLLLLPLLTVLRADPSGEPEPNPARPIPSESRALALRAAAPSLAQGFRVRDGSWDVTLAPGNPAFLKVTLFEGVTYLFAAASSAGDAALRIILRDGAGREIASEKPKESAPLSGVGAVAGIAPQRSGTYFVQLELVRSKGDSPADCSLVYAYK